MHYDEFTPMFEQQYPQYPWTEVEVSVTVLWLRTSVKTEGEKCKCSGVHQGGEDQKVLLTAASTSLQTELTWLQLQLSGTSSHLGVTSISVS